MQTVTIRNPNAPVTNKTLGQAVDVIIHGVERMFDKQDKRIDQRFKQVDGRLEKVDGRLEKVEAGQADIKRQLTDLKLDTPTRQEFLELKARVDKHHQLVD